MNETKEEALIREIKEELNIDISIDSYITTIEYDYSSFHLIMHVYRCNIINGDISLNEHLIVYGTMLIDLRIED